tara:strand:- start:94 stop:519 length:426 start_codon:yes stop_codon:yes gene_type:complete
MKKINFIALVVLTIVLSSCGSENSTGSENPTQNRGTPIDCGFVNFGYDIYAISFYDYVDDDGSYENEPDGKYIIQIKGKFTKGDYVLEETSRVNYIKRGNLYSPELEFGYGTADMKEVGDINTEGPAKAECSLTSIVPNPY